MGKSVNVSDECYEKIKRLAEQNYRNIRLQVEYLVDLAWEATAEEELDLDK